MALENTYSQVRARAAVRRRLVNRRLLPALFYVLLGLLNIGFLLVFGGTSFRASAMSAWSRIVPARVEPMPAEEKVEGFIPEQFPPGENWYSGSDDEAGQPRLGAPPHPLANGH